MSESKSRWNYQVEGMYKLNEDLSLDYVLFQVKFDGKIISTRILDEYPSEDECLSMLCDTKEEFLEKFLSNPIKLKRSCFLGPSKK